jgi:hypothetical protein
VKNPLAAHPPWRQIVIVSIALPTVIVLAVLSFAWPAARIAPRDVPVGVVGTGASAQQAVRALDSAGPGAFDIRTFGDEAAARAAIDGRDVYGAFVVDDDHVTVLEASAASPTVAQLLTTTGQRLASGSGSTLSATDVVPISSHDPRGLVLSSALLPLTICAIIIAAIAAVVVGLRPAWRQLLALAVISAVAGAGSFLIAQTFLGALPQDGLATWATLTLMLFALSSTTAGLVALIGPGGLAISAALMVFVGNPFSGVTSAPELLPGSADHLGQWLPPGAGANLLRSTAYFNGHGAGSHLLVLVLWALGGVGAIVVGHHTSPRFAAHAAHLAAVGGSSQSATSSSTSKKTNRTPADPSWASTGNNAPAAGVVTAALAEL